MPKFISGRVLERWGACSTRDSVVKLFPGEPGVPITPEAAARIMDAQLYPNPARWAGYLLGSTDRWRRFRGYIEPELVAEYARAQQRRFGGLTLEELADRRGDIDQLRQSARAVLNVTDPRRMAAPTVLRLYEYYAKYIGGDGEPDYPYRNAGNRQAVLWITALITRVLDQEPDDTPIDPGTAGRRE